MKFPINIPQYNVLQNEWSEREFTTRSEFSSFLDSLWKQPGQYQLDHTDHWIAPRLNWEQTGNYCPIPNFHADYEDWWKKEKQKVLNGLIVIGENTHYVTGNYYFYLNYCPIIDKLANREKHADIWDSDYHFYLYCERAEAQKKNVAIVKARQKGYSLKFVAMLIRDLWFIRQSVSKMVAYDEDYVNEKGAWKFAIAYRSHLIEHTEWSRSFAPDEVLHWEQKKVVTEGIVETKTTYKGLKSKLLAISAKQNPAKAVSGHITKLFCEEAGVFPNLDKVVEYGEAATKLSSVKTGMVYISGAVGELKDCKPLEELAFNPEDRGFLGIEDIFSEVPVGEICFFVPDTWNYIAETDEGEVIKCYDKHGNTDLELAEHYFKIEEELNKKKGADKFRLWRSQHPRNLKDAFGIREDNPFAVELIKEAQTKLYQTYKPMTVQLINDKGTVHHKFSEDAPVRSLKINPDKDNSGAIEIYELPVHNPPWGMYYAGVDPVSAKNTSTSVSLMSVTIYKAIHYVGDKIVMDYPVATYTGRHSKWETTYETTANLLIFYNARTAVENNIPDFIEWMIKKGQSRYLLRRKEIHMVNEFVPQSTIRDEIGIRMEGELKKKAISFLSTYIEEVIGTEFDQEGNSYSIYGVSRIKDPMLLEELLSYTSKLNTDRLIAFALAIMAARSNTNRNIIVEAKPSQVGVMKPRVLTPAQYSQFKRPAKTTTKLGSQFRKR
jgi:hypothetical protein